MNESAILFNRENGISTPEISGSQVQRISAAYRKIYPKEYNAKQLKELERLHNSLNSATMFEPEKVDAKQQAITDWHNANGNLQTPWNWNAPCID